MNKDFKIINLVKLLFISLLITITSGCSSSLKKPESIEAVRFDQALFEFKGNSFIKWKSGQPMMIKEFADVFTEFVIRIGPDTSAGFLKSLEEFQQDPVILDVKAIVDSVYGNGIPGLDKLTSSLRTFSNQIQTKENPTVVTYLSGFNQSFITLPGLLGLGLDQYLGDELSYYKDLGYPQYIIEHKTPENLIPDALRAWIISELDAPETDGSLLDQIIYQGKILYLVSSLLPSVKKENVFHYSKADLKWLADHEKAIWRFLASEGRLFSTDRMMILRMTEEAPFTRDFGQTSPDRAGNWIGYQIVSRYVKHTRTSMAELIKTTDARLVLEKAQYKP